ncbi:hypothetical protein J6590_010743 [Homalodisca vitripennis]|nr:hypothetical protein J6590_010743 [Homalodisca vitripennis]
MVATQTRNPDVYVYVCNNRPVVSTSLGSCTVVRGDATRRTESEPGFKVTYVIIAQWSVHRWDRARLSEVMRLGELSEPGFKVTYVIIAQWSVHRWDRARLSEVMRLDRATTRRTESEPGFKVTCVIIAQWSVHRWDRARLSEVMRVDRATTRRTESEPGFKVTYVIIAQWSVHRWDRARLSEVMRVDRATTRRTESEPGFKVTYVIIAQWSVHRWDRARLSEVMRLDRATTRRTESEPGFKVTYVIIAQWSVHRWDRARLSEVMRLDRATMGGDKVRCCTRITRYPDVIHSPLWPASRGPSLVAFAARDSGNVRVRPSSSVYYNNSSGDTPVCLYTVRSVIVNYRFCRPWDYHRACPVEGETASEGQITGDNDFLPTSAADKSIFNLCPPTIVPASSSYSRKDAALLLSFQAINSESLHPAKAPLSSRQVRYYGFSLIRCQDSIMSDYITVPGSSVVNVSVHHPRDPDSNLVHYATTDVTLGAGTCRVINEELLAVISQFYGIITNLLRLKCHSSAVSGSEWLLESLWVVMGLKTVVNTALSYYRRLYGTAKKTIAQFQMIIF